MRELRMIIAVFYLINYTILFSLIMSNLLDLRQEKLFSKIDRQISLNHADIINKLPNFFQNVIIY